MDGTDRTANDSSPEQVGPATVTEVMSEMEQRSCDAQGSYFRPLPTGFDPLDDLLNGGMREGELLLLGGSFGVGKTIFALQMARNVVCKSPDSTAIYICYEHDRSHLLARLLCLESVESGAREDGLTLRHLSALAQSPAHSAGLIERLRQLPGYAPVLETMDCYADRLLLVRASGSKSTMQQLRAWVERAQARGSKRVFVVVDYLQKIPHHLHEQTEVEATIYLAQSLKELALSTGAHLVALAASDRHGLQGKRVRLTDLRGSSALQYEADIGLVLNNKYAIVSREHLVYNPAQAESMRNWIVVSVEKNRSGRAFVDMEYELDGAHFHIVPSGRFVRERLLDEKVVLA